MELKRNIIKHLQNGFLHIFGGSILNKIIGFMTSLILLRILSKEEYGQFTYAWNIFGLILLANGLGAASSFLQISSEHYNDEKYCNNVFFYGLKVGEVCNIFLTACIIFIGLFVPLSIDGGRKLLLLLSVLPSLLFGYNMVSVYLRSRRKYIQYTYLSVIDSILLLIFAPILSLSGRTSGWVASHYISAMVSLVIGYNFCKINKKKLSSGLNRDEKKDFLKLAIITTFNDGISSMMYLLDIFILGIIVPQEEVLASYKAATIIPTALLFIPTSLITYVYPYFAEHSQDRMWCKDNYKKLLLYFSAFNIVLGSVLAVFAPIFIRIVLGQQYLDCVVIFQLLILNYFVSASFMKISGNILVTQRGLGYNCVIGITAGLTNIIGNYFLIRRYGAVGAAWATVCSSIVGSILSVIFLLYKFKQAPSVNNQKLI